MTKSNRFFRPSVHFLRLVKKAADSVRGLRAFYTKPFYSLRFPAARQKNKAGALHGRRSQKHTAPRLPWLCVGLYLRCAGAFQPRFRLQSTQKRTEIQAFLSVLGFIISLSCRSRLAATNGSGVRIVESSETNLGDLAADAYRTVTGADIAFVEASEIKADIAVGGMSYNDVMRALPGNKNISVAKVSGFDLLDALEMSARLYPNRNSGFLQVSGLTFDIQETVIPSVTVDGHGNFISVDDDYRVTNVMINGKELDLMETYPVAGTNDLLNGKTGYTMLTNGPLTKVNVTVDNQALITYILNNLKGSVGGAYSKSQMRIDSIKLARQSEIDALVEKKAEEKIKDYKAQLEALQKQVDAQEQIIAVKSLSINASSKFSKSSSGKRSIKVSWTTSSNVSGIKYQVYKSTKKTSGFKKAITTSKKYYTNTSGLKKGTTYYYKVRGYKYLNGKYYYSPWSDVTYKKVTK